ncbi:MAG: NAD(P)H-hydrate dehydratase [Pseudomonadales bacterium]|nr:NAD(P)H-hydrate dehydratase [Pseudomonadales bacterium]
MRAAKAKPDINGQRVRCARRQADLAALPGELYSSAQLRQIDQRAIAAGTAGIVLMRRAAAAALHETLQRWPSVKKILVLCGSGNNGGDGYLFARLAAQRGLDLMVVELGESRSADASTARKALLADGLQPLAWQALSDHHLSGCELVVDALLGTGLSGPPRAAYADAIAAINRAGRPVVALDIPSGLCSDSGCVLGDSAVAAQLTVSFIGLQRGLFTADAGCHVGELVLAPLGVNSQALLDTQSITKLDKLEPLLACLPTRSANHYKNRSGHVLVIGGNQGMAGAVLLAAQAALRAGAGLVSVATRPAHVPAVVAAQPEIMAHGVEGVDDLQSLLQRASAVLIGPGLGQDSWARQMLLACRSIKQPLVLDADGLNLAAQTPALLPAAPAVFTPHPGEAARLAAPIENFKQADRFALATALAQHYRKTIVLKGPGTITADAAQSWLCAYGNQALATGGTGDVLGGIIAALLAQGLAPALAARLAVCLHGAAADQWVAKHGPYGMLAGDLPLELVALLNRLAGRGN